MVRTALEDRDIVDWLLVDDQPSVRYFTLKELLDRRENDPEVRQAYSQIPRRGWARGIIKMQKPKGNWESADNLYRPKYTATNWRALVLSDLGLTKHESRVKKIANLYFDQWLNESEKDNNNNIFNDEVCIVGNTARMLTSFGYSSDSRVKRLYDRLLEDQKEDGGWHCFKSNVGSLDCWEGLAAFAALPRQEWTRKIKKAVERGAEFYLERELFMDGKDKYAPWFRFHYPNHYYYDLLVGLDVITKLGYGSDKRLLPALSILEEKRQADGTWLLDGVHPDLGRGANYSFAKDSIKPFAIEKTGKRSKWITLTALRVLKRVDQAAG